jgi:hypothetical protein
METFNAYPWPQKIFEPFERPIKRAGEIIAGLLFRVFQVESLILAQNERWRRA